MNPQKNAFGPQISQIFADEEWLRTRYNPAESLAPAVCLFNLRNLRNLRIDSSFLS
jgi:hypothetical protein